MTDSVKLQDDTSHVVVCFKKCYPENKILLDLVSRSWLHWDKERRQWLCYYPGKKEYKNLTMLVQSSVNPSPHWKRFPVEIIKEAKNFESGIRRLQRSVDEVNEKLLDSESNKGDFPIDQVEIFNESFLENEFTDVEELLNLFTPESISDSGILTPLNSLNFSDNNFDTLETVSPVDDHNEPGDDFDLRLKEAIRATKSEPSDNLWARVFPIFESLHESLREIKKGQQGLEKRFNALESESKEVIKQIKFYSGNTAQPPSKPDSPPTNQMNAHAKVFNNVGTLNKARRVFDGQFPFNDIKEFKNFNRELKIDKDKKKNLASFFAILTTGSNDPKRDIFGILGTLISKKVQERYSLQGRGQTIDGKIKKRFDTLAVYNVLREFISNKYRNDQSFVFTTVVSRWLSQAIDREGGRKERSTKKVKRFIE